MKPRQLILFAKSVWYSRWGQLGSRLGFVLRRAIMEWVCLAGIRPGLWYYKGAPSWQNGAPCGSVLPIQVGTAQLPIDVDLVGSRWTIDTGMDWNPTALNRGTRLEKLNLHYMQYLRRLCPPDAIRLMIDWINNVPPYHRGYWKDTWNSYSLSIRVVTWLDIVSFDRSRFGKAQLRRVEQSICAQLRFLERNLETDIGGNHLMKNLRALFRGACCFHGSEPERWLSVAIPILQQELREQVLPDGMHFELSPAYHLQVMEDLMDMRRALAFLSCQFPYRIGVQQSLVTIDLTLRKMAEVVQKTTHPDGLPSLFADAGLHMAAAPSEILGWLSKNIFIKEPLPANAYGPWRLKYGGYVGLVSQGELLMVDCGPLGPDHLPAHGHGDALALEWSYAGSRVFVDPGVYEYHAGPRRAYSRSSSAHSTLTVADADQSEFWSAFRVGRRARVHVEKWEQRDQSFLVVASHNGYKYMVGSPTPRRKIAAQSGRIDVIDEVRGGAGQPVRARLLLAPNVNVEIIDRVDLGSFLAKLFLPSIGQRGELVQIIVYSSVPIRVEPASYYPDFGVNLSTKRIIFELGPAPCAAKWGFRVVHDQVELERDFLVDQFPPSHSLR